MFKRNLAVFSALLASLVISDYAYGQAWVSDAGNNELEVNPTTADVAIGTTGPAARKLHVVASGNPQLRIGETTTGDSWDFWGGSNLHFIQTQNGSTWMKFDAAGNAVRLGPATELFIDVRAGVGNVGIGTTSPSTKLTVAGTITPSLDCSYNLGTSALRWHTVYACNGLLTSSDARMKDNIQDIKYGLNTVMQLHPVSYTWNSHPEDGVKLGLLAQEVETLVPNVVSTGDDGRKGIFYTDLIPVLIKAVQEQQATITSQAERISRLEEALAGKASPADANAGAKTPESLR